jgi:hypothetical protein
MRAVRNAIAVLLVCAAALTARGGDESSNPTLERLRAEERAREALRAAAAAAEAAHREERERVEAEKREQQAAAAREAQLRFELRREAMREWHRSFVELLAPVLAAREVLYQRLPRRMFDKVRPYCLPFRSAIEAAAPGYQPAPEKLIDALARELVAVYRDSARFCADGGYFSFTLREEEARRIVRDLNELSAPYGLRFPEGGAGARHESPVP